MSSLKPSKYFVFLIIILVLSIVVRLFLLHPTFSDESFYFNAGKQILKGDTPYKNFFFAHPPLQIYILAFLFKIFGTSLLVGKSLSLITSTLSVFLIYLIIKELYDEKSGFLSAIIFLVTPAFLSFSTMGHGMWETVLFVLLSTYLMIKNKLKFAGTIFVVAILFRYLALLYLPFLLVLLYLRKQKVKTFFLWFFLIFSISILLLIFIFNPYYLEQTVSYHIFSKISMSASEVQIQYWNIGYFFLFLSLISVIIAHTNKDKVLLLVALTSLITDVMILLVLKLIFYHYFLISLIFCIMAIGRVIIISKEQIVKIIIPIILLLSIISNLETIDFYLNPTYAERYYSIANLIENKTSIDDSIFGEPVATNYVSFVTNRRISSNYLDSYIRHLIFEDEQKVIENLEKDKPKIFIELESYYMSNPYFRDFIFDNYILEKKLEGTPNYSIYRLKT
jgi:4-amino-4-deoxy-L-arabinose transferase-like glycosyltransferase